MKRKKKPTSPPTNCLFPRQIPETADDFLALGVENEEAAEKWRAGDAAKSSRFYVRALEAYEGGLARYSSSFDLAYNKYVTYCRCLTSSP